MTVHCGVRPVGPIATGLTDAATVIRLQRTAGNMAIVRLLSASRPQAPTGRQPADVVVARSDESRTTDLLAEHTQIGRQLERMSPEKPAYGKLLRRQDAIDRELTRLGESAPTGTPASIAARGPKAQADALVRAADGLSADLAAFLEEFRQGLAFVESDFETYFGHYERAYDQFVKVLGQAKSDAAAREALIGALAGIVIGTGLGLGAGAILGATRGLGKLIEGASTEVAEFGVATGGAQLYTAAPGIFDPSGSSAAVKASEGWRKLAQAWKAYALLNQPILAFGRYVTAVKLAQAHLGSWATGGRPPHSIAELARTVHRLRQPGPATMSKALGITRSGFRTFMAMANTPVLHRSPGELEQDMWILWMSRLGDVPPSVGPLAKLQRPARIRERIYDALDEDAVEKHLRRIGVLGGKFSRTRVDFGDWTSASDTAKAHEQAKSEQARMQQLGRLAVAITPVTPGTGLVRMRHDAYRAAGRPDPEPESVEHYYRATTWWLKQSLRPGTVGLVRDTESGRLAVSPLDPTMKPLPITAMELSPANVLGS